MKRKADDDRTPRDIREDLGLSPDQVCESADITGATLAKIEAGAERVTVRVLERVASVYGLPASSLLAACERARVTSEAA